MLELTSAECFFSLVTKGDKHNVHYLDRLVQNAAADVAFKILPEIIAEYVCHLALVQPM